MKTYVNTQEALAAALYAFRANNNTVVRDSYDPNCLDKFPNKAYLVKYFSESQFCPELSAFTLTNELLAEADNLKQELEYIITMAALTKGQINSFTEDCAKLLAKETVNSRHFGTIVWIPKIVHDQRLRSDAKIKSATLEHTSKFIGRESDRVELYFNIIEKRFVRQINCWAVYGHNNDGNLVKFLTKHEDLCQSGHIKGRIKSTEKDAYHNYAQVTVLNHVKKI